MYSAYIKERAVVCCLTDDYETRFKYMKKAYPVILFCVKKSNAQLVSTASKFAENISFDRFSKIGQVKLYFNAKSQVSDRYRNICFTASR